jgi:ligand-binding sensor protein
MMKIQDFADMKHFEELMANWAAATNLATVAVGVDGEHISKCYNFTDFCMNMTRGTSEGLKRCEKCDQEGKGTYFCHAGLIDFSIDLMVDGEKLGKVIGGQVLSKQPDEENIRKIAKEIGVNEDHYIRTLAKVPIKSESSIRSSAYLLGEMLNNFLNSEYHTKHNDALISNLKKGVIESEKLVEEIRKNTNRLNGIQQQQNILALNANIEAARAGDAGRGFAVVATDVGRLSRDSAVLNHEITDSINKISKVVTDMASVGI